MAKSPEPNVLQSVIAEAEKAGGERALPPVH